MKNLLWDMMISNARSYLDTFDPRKDLGNEDRITIFEISAVLAILTGKTKEDIVIEIAQNQTNENKN